MSGPPGESTISARFLGHNLRFLLTGRWRMPRRHEPPGPADIPPDFFGICVASSPDPACDDYVIARLKALNLRHVRLDYTYSSPGSFAERFFERLLTDGFRVCLHLVQPFAEAAAMDTEPARESWARFVRSILERYAERIEMLEIGSTCNRRKWTGQGLAGFVATWRIGHAEARRFSIRLAGPNVTDFEPAYNFGLLGVFRDFQILPDVHSDNLFVERCTEPEAFDPRIAGRALAPLLKYNLVKKAALLKRISAMHGVGEFVCAHVAWSSRRIARVLQDVEQKQADYLARYCCLAAASGAFRRIYWGPLIGQREGLVDDGTLEYPDIPHVTFYGLARGDAARYRDRPALDTYRTVIELLAGAALVRKPRSERGLEILEFRTARGLLHAVWTANGRGAPASDCYEPDTLPRASAVSRDGRPLGQCPALFTESPTYLAWPSGLSPRMRPRPHLLSHARFHTCGISTFNPLESGDWTGMCAGTPPTPDAFSPDRLERTEGRTVLRDARNCVWTVPDPANPAARIAVKRFGPVKGLRRFLGACGATHALRSWSGANELLRRGIPTPPPLAFVQRRAAPLDAFSYYICAYCDATGSVRTAFTAFANGEVAFQGVGADEFYSETVRFLLKMHDRGVFFRDLSAGNLLVKIREGRDVEFFLIDTARARFYSRPVTMAQRIADLIRICHPFDWVNRERFVGLYMRRLGRRFSGWMRLPFAWYDIKHAIKQGFKAFEGRS